MMRKASIAHQRRADLEHVKLDTVLGRFELMHAEEHALAVPHEQTRYSPW